MNASMVGLRVSLNQQLFHIDSQDLILRSSFCSGTVTFVSLDSRSLKITQLGA